MTNKIIEPSIEETTSTQEEITTRANACMLCENLILGEYPRCSQNNESMMFMAKIVDNKCPIGKW